MKLSRALAAPLTVAVDYFDSNAEKGKDYTAAPTSFTIPAGETEHTLSVPIIDDGLEEGPELFQIRLRPPALPDGHGYNSKQFIIQANDEVTASLASGVTSTAVPEGATVPISTRLSRRLVADETLALPMTIGGTAIRGTDYTLRCLPVAGVSCENLNSGAAKVTLDGAQLSQTGSRPILRFLQLELVEDGTAESQETVTLRFDGNTLTVGIVDAPSSVTVAFAKAATQAHEHSIHDTVFTVTPPAGQDIVVPLTFTDGTAMAGEDYRSISSATIPAGRSRPTVSISMVDDDVHEPNETFTVAIDTANLPAGVTAGAITTQTVTILDNDSPVAGEVRLGTPTPARIAEGASAVVGIGVFDSDGDRVSGEGQAWVLVCFGGKAKARYGRRVHASDDFRLEVSYGADGGVGHDRNRWWLVGAGRMCGRNGLGAWVILYGTDTRLRLTAIADHRAEGEETVVLRVGGAGFKRFPGDPERFASVSPGGGPVTVAIEPSAAVGPAASFAAGASSAAEDAGTHSVRVSLSRAAPSALTLAYAVSGTATAGADYTALAGTVAVAAGATHVDIAVALTDDGEDERDETVLLTLAEGAGYTVGTAGEHTLTIADDDVPAASFAAATSSAAEDAGTHTVRVSLSPAPHTALALAYTVSGTAVSGADYTALPGTVAVAAGATEVDIAVALTDDGTRESEETLTLTLAGGAGYAVGAAGAHTLAIADDDAAGPVVLSVRVDPSAGPSRPEDHTGNVVLVVAPSAPVAENVFFRACFGGSATRDADYEVHLGTVKPTGGCLGTRVSAGDASYDRMYLKLLDDADDEPYETVVVTLSAHPDHALPAGVALAAAPTATFTITDDDDPPSSTPVVSITGGDAVTEGGNARFILTASPKPTSPIGVKVAVTERGRFAQSGQTGVRTVAVGPSGTGGFSVTTDDDTTGEANGAISATLGAGSGYSPHNTEAHASVAVHDDDTPPPGTPVVSITGGPTVTEGGNARFTLTATPKPAATLQVSVDVGQTGSFAGSGQTGVRTVPVGTSGTADFTVATVDDTTGEADGAVTATVDTGSGYAPHNTDASASVRVNDDDTPLPNVYLRNSGNVSHKESAGTIELDLVPTRTLSAALPIGYTLGGSATCGTDYTIAGADCTTRTGTFTLPAGPAWTAVALPITIVADSVADNAETLVLTLAPGAGYRVGHPSATTVTLYEQTGSATFSVTGTPRVGETLTVTRDASDPDGDGTVTYRWRWTDDGGDWIVGLATNSPTYTLVEADAGRYFGVQADYTDGKGFEEFIYTAPVGPVAPALGTPVVSIAGGGAVTEGAGASFTLTASPKPTSTIQVKVNVADSGSFAASGQTGARTVAVGTSGTAGFTVGTVNDNTDEPDGTITATVQAGTGYAPHSSDASDSVAVNDDDAPGALSVVLSIVNSSGDTTTPVTSGKERNHRLLKVSLSNANFAKTLEWCVRSGTATYSTSYHVPDYGFTDGINTLALTQGCWSQTLQADVDEAELNLQVRDDSDDEPAETFTVYAKVTETGGSREATSADVTYTIVDDDATTVTLSGNSDAIDEDGGTKTLTVTLGRALVADEWLSVPLDFTGEATRGTDYTLACAQAAGAVCWFPNAGNPQIRFTGGAGAATTVTFTLTSVDDTGDEGAGETVTVKLGTLGTTGLDGGTSKSGSVTFTITDDDLPPPVITIAPGASPVAEGASASFTLTADRAPAADLEVSVDVRDADGADYLLASDEGARTVTIAATGTTATLTLATQADDVDEPDGAVRVTVRAGDGYEPGSPASAQVVVEDDDVSTLPTLSVFDATGREGAHAQVTIRLSKPSERPVRVLISSREATPVSAVAGEDFMVWTYRDEYGGVEFRPGETETTRGFFNWPDAHDDDGETYEVYLHAPEGATIADAVAVVTIENDDPLPAAWLARFGRTVASQALDGISERMAAPRTPGMAGTLAGQALPSSQAAAGARPEDPEAARALGRIAHGFGARTEGSGAASPFGDGLSAPHAQTRSMSAREALLASRFTLTGAEDAVGGTLALWGRVSQGSFDGVEQGDGAHIRLDGEVTTGMLGADYARERWLAGLVLLQSDAEGDYATEGETCPAMPAGMPDLCEEMAGAGDGSIDASLTAAVPYASVQASERLKLWGALGYGAGEVTLETKRGARYEADTGWTMAAVGMRGDLLAPSAPGSGAGGPALALTSDALWARTSSDKARGLAASDSDTTRLRLGLEGSWRVALDGGGSLVPKLEIGARHDGGDAETGFGVELGGGIAWSDPGLGLSLDLSGRTLLAHEDGDLKDRGYAASLAFDPAPASERGPSLSLRQEFGGRAAGGLDALFQPDPLAERTGSGTAAASRWTLEAAYGFPAFGGRWTGSPHAGLGLATGARDYSLGWRLTPAANANAPDLSFGVKATRSESDTAEPEHRFGFEAVARW